MKTLEIAAKTEVALLCEGTNEKLRGSRYEDFGHYDRRGWVCPCPVCGRNVEVVRDEGGVDRFRKHGGLHVR